MNSPAPGFPAPRTYKDVPLIPPVDPDDLKRVWNVKPPWTAHSHQDACSPGADVSAVVNRRHMIDTLVTFKLLTPWTHDEQLDDAVFRLAATFPLHELQDVPYMIPGDEKFPFDPNSFLQRLVEETGVAHVWEPVPIKVGDGGRGYVLCSFATHGAAWDPDREARHKTRELLHHIWRRFSGFGHLLSRAGSEHSSQLPAILFADFLIANTDIVEQVVNEFRQGPGGVGPDLLLEIEQRAMKRI